VPLIDDLRSALAGRVPTVLPSRQRAAVAVVLHDGGGGEEMLFIERARRLGDPWSGHMAFPGGRLAPSDPGPSDAAARETREEVGVDLTSAEVLGQLDDVAAGVPLVASLTLSTFVYRLAERPALQPNHEVESAFWVAIEALVDPTSHTGYWFGPVKLPGICVGDAARHVVWGLTYRVLESLFAVAGRPLR
jgi:8-oxo-dGTP pyrophosphatase MutT (NUDIX family)